MGLWAMDRNSFTFQGLSRGLYFLAPLRLEGAPPSGSSTDQTHVSDLHPSRGGRNPIPTRETSPLPWSSPICFPAPSSSNVRLKAGPCPTPHSTLSAPQVPVEPRPAGTPHSRTVVKSALPQEGPRHTLGGSHVPGVIIFYQDQNAKRKSASLPKDVGRRPQSVPDLATACEAIWAIK